MPITPNPDADFTPDRYAYSGTGEFRFWCQTVLPLVYDDSLSYYELLNKVVNYLNSVIRDLGFVETNVTNLFTAYTQLENYVNNYFHSLDVQQEIDAKLDEMASSGALSELINPFIGPAVTDWLGEHVTPTTPIVDDTLSIEEAAADAASVGTVIYGSKSRSNNKAIAFTFWDMPDTFTTANPAGPTDMPLNSYTANTGAILAGFNNNKFNLTAGLVYWVYRFISRHNSNIQSWIIYSSAGSLLAVGTSTNAGSTIGWYKIGTVDNTLSQADEAADAATVGSAIYSTKNRTNNLPAAFTWWEATNDYSSENPASIDNIPANSFTAQTGALLKGLEDLGITLNNSATYWVVKFGSKHNLDIQSLFIYAPSLKKFTVLQTNNRWSTNSIYDISVDTTLSVSGAAADAATVGSAIYGTKDREQNIAGQFTWWEPPNTYTAENPIAPTNMPVNSYTAQLGSILAGFNTTNMYLAPGQTYYVFHFRSRHSGALRIWLLIASTRREVWIGTTSNSSNPTTWVNVGGARSAKIMWFGDSITRSRIGGQNALASPTMPTMVQRILGAPCENFGIGNIGWINGTDGNNHKVNCFNYLKRVGNSNYYNSSDTWGGYKFLGRGNWSDFNTIVISLGTNDTNRPLGSLSDIDDTLSFSTVMGWNTNHNSNYSIAQCMYQVYRYIRESETQYNSGVYVYADAEADPDQSTPVYVTGGANMQIIITDPLMTSGSGSAPEWSYNTTLTGGYTRKQLNTLYADFCQKYGCGHISTYEAPIDRINPGTNSLPDNVHPNQDTYNNLARFFAGKIGTFC